jgi:hypothetical protein
VLYDEDFGDVFCGQFVRESREALANDKGADRTGSVCGDLLGGG